MFERVLSLWERMTEGQVRAGFELSRSSPHPSAAKNAALRPLPEGEGLLIDRRSHVDLDAFVCAADDHNG
jgi:hypothetical protein